MEETIVREISEHNLGTLLRKSLSNNIVFLNGTPGVVTTSTAMSVACAGKIGDVMKQTANSISANRLKQCLF